MGSCSRSTSIKFLGFLAWNSFLLFKLSQIVCSCELCKYPKHQCKPWNQRRELWSMYIYSAAKHITSKQRRKNLKWDFNEPGDCNPLRGTHAHTARRNRHHGATANKNHLSFSRIRPHFNQTRFEKSQLAKLMCNHTHQKPRSLLNPLLRRPACCNNYSPS